MSNSVEELESNLTRIKRINACILAILLVPTILDFFFIGSNVARFSRILLFLGISASLIINRELMLKNRLIGTEIIFMVIILYIIGTLVSLKNGGVITPNIALLLLFLLVVSANIDLHKYIIKSIALSSHILIGFSTLAILLKLNSLELYFNPRGYPVYFNSIGIPGRNYGIFAHPNTLGGIASTSLLFMIGFKWKKIYMLLPIFCLIKSGSRTAILVSLLVLIIYSIRLIFLSQKISTSLRKIEFPLVVGTFLMGILLAATVQFLNYIDLIDPSALTARAQIWQRSFEIFKASSLFGLGFNWEDRAIESQLLNLWATSAHNVLLEILFATGIVGLVVVLFCIVKVLAFFPNLDLIEKLAVVAMLTIGISESFISVQYPSFLTYLFFAIAVGANREMKERL